MEQSDVKAVLTEEAAAIGWMVQDGIPDQWVTHIQPGMLAFWLVRPVDGGREQHALFQLPLSVAAQVSEADLRSYFRQRAQGAPTPLRDRLN